MKLRTETQSIASWNQAVPAPAFPSVSLGIVLLFAAASYVVFGWTLAFGLHGEEGAELEQLSQSNLSNQLIWISLAGLGLCVMIGSITRGARPALSPSLIFLAAYAVLMLLSMSWALAPDISLRRAVQQLLIVSIFAGVPVFMRNRVHVLNAIFLVLAISIGLNALLFPVIPPGPLGYAGIYAQKNELGAVSALALIFCITYLFSSRGSYKIVVLGIALASGGLLVVSQSKTSLGLALICPALAVGIVAASRFLRMPFLAATAVIVTVAGFFSYIAMEATQTSFSDISMFLFNDTTFTGRTTIWTYVLKFFDLHPWLGWGYQSFWSIGNDAPSLKADSFVAGLNQSHNGYIDLLLETGIVGFSIVCAFLVALIRAIDLSWKERADVAILLLSLTLFCGIHNLLESSLTRGFAIPWVILLLIAGLSNPARQAAPAAKAA